MIAAGRALGCESPDGGIVQAERIPPRINGPGSDWLILLFIPFCVAAPSWTPRQPRADYQSPGRFREKTMDEFAGTHQLNVAVIIER